MKRRNFQYACWHLPLACLILAGACRTLPPPSTNQDVRPAPEAPRVWVDDIPADAPPTVRAHLIKLREMRDFGQITDAEYQSRKAALVRK